jgi:hypothetical protein
MLNKTLVIIAKDKTPTSELYILKQQFYFTR